MHVISDAVSIFILIIRICSVAKNMATFSLSKDFLEAERLIEEKAINEAVDLLNRIGEQLSLTVYRAIISNYSPLLPSSYVSLVQWGTLLQNQQTGRKL